MYYCLWRRLSPYFFCRLASVEMTMEGSLLAVLTQHRLLGLWHHHSEPAFFSLCLVSTVRPHGVCMCKAPQKRLHISICRLKWSTHPSPLAFLLIKNVVLLYVCYLYVCKWYLYSACNVQCMQCTNRTPINFKKMSSLSADTGYNSVSSHYSLPSEWKGTLC